MAADPVVKEIYIEASPQVVFEFLTRPEKMIRWMGLQAELEPRPGGIYRVDPNSQDVIRGEYVQVVPHSRIVFTFGWENDGHSIPPGATTVEIELTPERSGTRLRLTHHDLPPAAHDMHAQGWGHYIERLKMIAEGRDPGPDPLADPSVRHG